MMSDMMVEVGDLFPYVGSGQQLTPTMNAQPLANYFVALDLYTTCASLSAQPHPKSPPPHLRGSAHSSRSSSHIQSTASTLKAHIEAGDDALWIFLCDGYVPCSMDMCAVMGWSRTVCVAVGFKRQAFGGTLFRLAVRIGLENKETLSGMTTTTTVLGHDEMIELTFTNGVQRRTLPVLPQPAARPALSNPDHGPS